MGPEVGDDLANDEADIRRDRLVPHASSDGQHNVHPLEPRLAEKEPPADFDGVRDRAELEAALSTLMSSTRRALGIDPVLRARLFNEVLAEIDAVAKQLQSARLDAVSALREHGYSYDEIAHVLKVSKARAQQLVAAARRRNRRTPS